MIKKTVVLFFAVLIFSASCEDDNPVGTKKNQQAEYLFSKLTLSIENVVVQKYYYYEASFPPEFEDETSEQYDTLIKTFEFIVPLEEESQNNRGDTISYYGYDGTDLYTIDFIIDQDNQIITHFEFDNNDIITDDSWYRREYNNICNISKLYYSEKDNIIEANVNSSELMGLLTAHEFRTDESEHWTEENTEYTILNITDSSRITLKLEMAE